MAACFGTLPPELVSHICRFADFSSLANLRLVSRDISAIFTPCFARYFQPLSIDLTRQGFQKLRRLLSLSNVFGAVRTIRFVCVYYHETPALDGPETCFPEWTNTARTALNEPLCFLGTAEERDWMEDRQAAQFAFSGDAMCEELAGLLRTLPGVEDISLEPIVVLTPKMRLEPEHVESLSWRELWSRMVQAYRVVMSSVSRSQIRLSSLSIYRKTRICSIPTNEAAAILPRVLDEAFETVALGLRSFSISIATTVFPVRPRTQSNDKFYEPFDISSGRIVPGSDPAVDEHGDLEGFGRLVRLMPNLESLFIHLYQTTTPAAGVRTAEEVPYQDLLGTVFRTASFPLLQTLVLQGLCADPHTMRAVASACPRLICARLRNMYITTGLWDASLVPLTDIQSLTSLQLSNLWFPYEGRLRRSSLMRPRPIPPYGTRESYDLIRYAAKYWHTREFGVDEIRAGIEHDFSLTKIGGLASGEDWLDRIAVVMESGPPSKWI